MYHHSVYIVNFLPSGGSQRMGVPTRITALPVVANGSHIHTLECLLSTVRLVGVCSKALVELQDTCVRGESLSFLSAC